MRTSTLKAFKVTYKIKETRFETPTYNTTILFTDRKYKLLKNLKFMIWQDYEYIEIKYVEKLEEIPNGKPANEQIEWMQKVKYGR